jgi:hypothetical protein
LYIFSEFDWEIIKSSPLEKTLVSNPLRSSDDPQLLHLVELRITLSKRTPSGERWKNYFLMDIVNDGSFKDDAFRAKSFTVRIEEGNFLLPSENGDGVDSINDPLGATDRSNLRILLDPSPYPPWSEMHEYMVGPKEGWQDIIMYARPKEFIGNTVEGLNGN